MIAVKAAFYFVALTFCSIIQGMKKTMLLSMIISRMIYGLRIRIIFSKRKMNTLKRRRMSVPLLADVKIQRRGKKGTQSINHKKFSRMIYGLRIGIIFLKRKMTTLKRRRMSVPLLAVKKIETRSKKITRI
ncbi:Uncharacterised protein [Enterococcus malodoratus]|uniref:Uncharacterized protein n=1 Tax=Enterococcus malodoratus ATCC 43197 TaxID=1158601 RepID=R2RAZ1_9ENTE|nr:hypothetical protein UAI_00896 [Enterococcus malodoratus ATCC 43197]EOT69364.1 hypothetical protein I585_00827 [Enterococcus malodoratus ATCC 43197]SPW68755.1 Uncharacterised protein [Enterococcus malodoratus]STC71282.1 Uncharacterised protein [Enterococcus malodoratus]